jgi:hypothetical protein
LSTTNPTWTDLAENPGLCAEKPGNTAQAMAQPNEVIYVPAYRNRELYLMVIMFLLVL